jgi:hypothetical protein
MRIKLVSLLIADAILVNALPLLLSSAALGLLGALFAFLVGGSPLTGAWFSLTAVPFFVVKAVVNIRSTYSNLTKPGSYLYTTCWGLYLTSGEQ